MLENIQVLSFVYVLSCQIERDGRFSEVYLDSAGHNDVYVSQQSAIVVSTYYIEYLAFCTSSHYKLYLCQILQPPCAL